MKRLRQTGFFRPMFNGQSISERFHISRTLIALLCCTSVMLLCAVTLSFWSFKQIGNSERLRLQTRNGIISLNTLLAELQDAESSQRGFLLTGDESFLTPYITLRSRIPLHLKELSNTLNRATAGPLPDDIDQKANAILSELADTIALKRQHDDNAAIAMINKGHGRKMLEDLRAEVATLLNGYQLTLESERLQNRSNQRYLFEGVALISLLALVMSLATAFFIRRAAQHHISRIELSESERLLEIQRHSNEQLWQAHLLLMKNREQLRAFIQHAPVCLVMFDLDMNYLAVSDSWKATFEDGRQDLVGLNQYELHPDTLVWREQHRAGFAGNIIRKEEELRLRSDGRVQWVSWVLQPWRDETGTISGIILAAEDVSEKKMAKARQLEAESRLHSIIDSAMDAIITIDEKFIVLLINPAACVMFGVAQTQALGNSIERFIPARHREMHIRNIKKFGNAEVTGGDLGNPIEVIGVRANGQEFPGEATISQVVINGAKMFTIILRDQTARAHTELALRESEAFNIATLNSVEAEIAVLDRQGIIVAVNQPWLNFANQNKRADGSLPDRIEAGTNYLAACQVDDVLAMQAYRGISSVIAGTSARFSMIYPCNSDSERRWFHMSVTPMGAAAGNVVVAHTDITATKKVEEALQQSQSALRDLLDHQHRVKEEERIRIAREIHDELGSRLTAIKAHILVLMEHEQADGKGDSQLLKDSCAMLDSSIDTVRDIILDLRPSVIDNLGIWAALEWYCGQTAKRGGFFCDFSIEPPLEEYPIGPDMSTALFRILQETLTNVIRHAHPTEVAVRLNLENQIVRMEVEDNGCGIDLEKIRQSEKSWGITGMVERARYLGGSVDITRTEDGTLVSLSLPLQPRES